MAVPNPTGARSMLRVATALASIIACLLAAMVLSALVGSSGRDPRPAAIFMAIFLVAAAFYLSRLRAHRVRELIVALLIAELFFVAAIGWFASGGLPQFDCIFLLMVLRGQPVPGVALAGWRGAGNIHASPQVRFARMTRRPEVRLPDRPIGEMGCSRAPRIAGSGNRLKASRRGSRSMPCRAERGLRRRS